MNVHMTLLDAVICQDYYLAQLTAVMRAGLEDHTKFYLTELLRISRFVAWCMGTPTSYECDNTGNYGAI